MLDPEKTAVYRILDANINRLREALRVIEERYRFADNNTSNTNIVIELKGIRHSLKDLAVILGNDALVASRDTKTDILADTTSPDELDRLSMQDITIANFKRAQEAARVLEEYSKLAGAPSSPETAKNIRFSIYDLEKKLMERNR
jgi:hypothetical protein